MVSNSALPAVSPLGWRAAFPDWQPADEKGDEAQLLPPLRNGETAQLHDPKIEDKETRPPPRYNEGTLIEAMQNAWRFVDDEALRERLREASIWPRRSCFRTTTFSAASMP
jgi:DNA topoisomerase-3